MTAKDRSEAISLLRFTFLTGKLPGFYINYGLLVGLADYIRSIP
jgi:hypothetical protein